MKILIVDDSMLMHRMYEMAVDQYPEPLSALSSTSAEVALALLNSNPDIGIVFVDKDIPTMGGAGFIEAVRRNDALRGVRIVLQGTEESGDVTTEAVWGADGYLAKPFTADKLHGIIDRLRG